MEHNTELLNWDKIDLLNPNLDVLYNEMMITQKQMQSSLDRIESGQSAMNYEDQEFFAQELREKLDSHKYVMELLETALNMRKLIHGISYLPQT